MNKEKNNFPPQTSTKEKSITIAQFEGPLPHPQVLAEYDRVSHGAADRILTMAENEAKHRHNMEERALKAQIWEIRLGQIFGFSIGIFTIAAGAFCAIRGAQIAGSIIGGGGVIGLVSVFIAGRKKE
jgi:uncharacterized membrane protein